MEQIQGDSPGEPQLASAAISFSRARYGVFAKLCAMSSRLSAALLTWLAATLALAVASHATIIRFQTTLGNIDIRLYDSATPLHTANILNYISSDRYDGTFIHRAADSIRRDANGNPILDNMGNPIRYNFVVQGGGYKINTSLFGSISSVQSFGNVENEPGISNLRGTLALAKSTGISSGTSQWFINLDDDNDFLDQPPPASNLFTVFGRLIRNTITVADAIANLPTVNAGTGTPFEEIPVTDYAKVIQMQDVTNNEAVVVSDVRVLNYPAGDYNFDGTVNLADYQVWKADYGSTLKAEADGNGNGRVDAADYVIWRNTFGQTSVPGGGSIDALPVPEPTSAMLAAIGSLAWFCTLSRRRSSL